jgi:hypothetical protein
MVHRPRRAARSGGVRRHRRHQRAGRGIAARDWLGRCIEEIKGRFDRNVQYATEAIVAIGAIKAAPWILRALGWLLPGEVLGVPTAPIALPLALGGDTADNPKARIPYDPITNPNLFYRYGAGGLWWASRMPGWPGGGGLPTNRAAGPRAGVAPMELAVPYQAGAILGSMGITSGQYSAFREGIARIEHARYNQMGGAGDRYAGRYQMGPTEIAETARRLFVPVPTRERFLADPAMQERFFEAYTASHNDQLMRDSARYRAMTPEQRLEVLGYAHSHGVGGAEAWLETSQVGRDAFGTPGTAYADAVAAALSAANLGSAPNGVPGVGPVFGPQSPANGHVTVDIRLHGAPAGTTASVVTSGGVVAPASRIETSMPLGR